MSRVRFGIAGLLLVCAAPLAAQNARSLEQWVTQLGSKDHGPRNAAYRELMRDRSPRIPALIGKQIGSFPQISQQLACNLLRNHPLDDARGVYRDMLAAKNAYLRVVAAARLLGGGPKAAVRKRHMQTLLEGLASCGNGRKMAALDACRSVPGDEVLAAMRDWLQPKQPQHIVVGVLRELLRRERDATEATTAAAVRLCEAAEARVAGAAHAYLLRRGGEHGKRLAELCDKEPAVFWTVRDLLPKAGSRSKEVVEVMVAALRKPRSERDVNQLAQLMKSGSQAELGGVLRELLGHDKDDIRAAALKQLSTLPGGLKHADLVQLLKTGAVAARLVAADTLRRRDDPVGLDAVLASVDKAGKHKAEAMRVLGRFRARKAIPVLLDALADKDLGVRVAAWDGLKFTMNGLFPYRRFDFRGLDYDPRGQGRAAAIAQLRQWWASVK